METREGEGKEEKRETRNDRRTTKLLLPIRRAELVNLKETEYE